MTGGVAVTVGGAGGLPLRTRHGALLSPLALPGSTNTPIYQQAANYTGREAVPPFPVMQPERTAQVIAGLADRPRRQVSFPVGRTNPAILAGFRIAPRLFDLLVGPLFKIASLRGPQDATTGNVLRPVPGRERVRGR